MDALLGIQASQQAVALGRVMPVGRVCKGATGVVDGRIDVVIRIKPQAQVVFRHGNHARISAGQCVAERASLNVYGRVAALLDHRIVRKGVQGNGLVFVCVAEGPQGEVHLPGILVVAVLEVEVAQRTERMAAYLFGFREVPQYLQPLLQMGYGPFGTIHFHLEAGLVEQGGGPFGAAAVVAGQGCVEQRVAGFERLFALVEGPCQQQGIAGTLPCGTRRQPVGMLFQQVQGAVGAGSQQGVGLVQDAAGLAVVPAGSAQK